LGRVLMGCSLFQHLPHLLGGGVLNSKALVEKAHKALEARDQRFMRSLRQLCLG
jgi:hypothetical protein